MHRLVTSAPAGADVDHINGDGLDNRRENLRCATRSQNNANQRCIRAGKSRFKGVWMNSNKFKKWTAEISKDGKTVSKTFFSEEEAGNWYDRMANQMFGEFAKTNMEASK